MPPTTPLAIFLFLDADIEREVVVAMAVEYRVVELLFAVIL
jgi:hypothetical protein